MQRELFLPCTLHGKPFDLSCGMWCGIGEVSGLQATSPGTRRLQQAPSPVNAHFQAQATDASTAVSARDQLESAAAAGSLAVGSPSVPGPEHPMTHCQSPYAQEWCSNMAVRAGTS